jgi:hypothetical protein
MPAYHGNMLHNLACKFSQCLAVVLELEWLVIATFQISVLGIKVISEEKAEYNLRRFNNNNVRYLEVRQCRATLVPQPLALGWF